LKFDSDNPLLTLSESEQLRLLREDLKEKCEVLEYDEFVVMDMNGFIIASLNDESLGEQIPLDRFDFVQKALSGEVTVSRPFPAVAELPDDDGVVRKGTPTMFAVSPIFHETGRVIAVLALRINPETRFTQILRIARIWDSGEAYAFDRNGLMLSQSRFDDQLRSVGLLPKEEYVDSKPAPGGENKK